MIVYDLYCTMRCITVEQRYVIFYLCLYQLLNKKSLEMKTLFFSDIIYYEMLSPIKLGY